MYHPPRGLQVMDDYLVGHIVHVHDIFALHIYLSCQPEMPFECARDVIMLDMFRRAYDRVHQDKEMPGTPVPLLVFQEKIHECLLEFHNNLLR